ncbi:tetratricopeptide repeat protein [Roseateles sp. DAIF2]|uniref:LytR C-terminal domain-containing protein n=1 Tax=Roseateles sp. DAIF2 TaxID=2714952 RepID=UPI0018A2EAE8|nr:LytR C-terminal domain-containing protein [Roseateles sp. DAIF2]QPF73549.1 tetratricopeptide repeat protein [Roseateles sp. DAIF2]
MRMQARFAPPAALPPAAPAPAEPVARTLRRPLLGLTLLAGVALAGCAALDQARPWWKVEPVYQVQDGPLSAAAYLALARYFEGSRDWERAVHAYRRALARDEGLVEAHDGLGQALAQLGRLDAAEAALRRALALAPQRPHLQNNLAYVLLLAGRADEAVEPLQRVLAQQPANSVAQANLQQALARRTLATLSIEQPAPPAVGPADATLPAIMISTAAPSAPATTGTAMPAEGDAPSRFRLEVSNGNGAAGMAARVGQRLAAAGLPAARLSNQLPYTETRTLVQYREGQEAAAQRVARALPEGVPASARLQPGLRGDVRLLLGQDWPQDAACRVRGNSADC